MMAKSASGDAKVEIALREAQTYVPGIQHPQAVLDALAQFDSVTGASPVLRGNVNIRSGFKSERGRLHGIDLVSYLEVTELETQTPVDEMKDFAQRSDGILVGQVLAERLALRAGDAVFLEGRGGDQIRFYVSGIFSSGIGLVDQQYFLRTPAQRPQCIGRMGRCDLCAGGLARSLSGHGKSPGTWRKPSGTSSPVGNSGSAPGWRSFACSGFPPGSACRRSS